MKLTIIVPAYNEEEHIEKCLKSLSRQKNKNFELIIVDNNSTDNTIRIAKKYSRNIYIEKERGYHNAVRKGVLKANGDLIAACDADSIYPSNWTQKVYSTFHTNKDIIAFYGSVKLHDVNKYTRKIYEKIFYNFMVYMRYKGVDVCNGPNFVFKKNAYKKVGGYGSRVYDQAGVDIELGMRLKTVGKMIFVPSIFVWTSLRRAEKTGLIKMVYKNLVMYNAFINNKKIKETYNEYNIKR